MKKILTILFILMLVSCKKEKLEISEKIETVNDSIETVEDPYKDLYGNWVGDFVASVHDTTTDFVYSNKINIVIKKIEKNRVFGQSIVAGNSRPLSGEFKIISNGYEFTLIEPGDKKYDGRFEFSIENKILKGTWFSNDKKQHVTQRTFELKKQEFKYNPNNMLTNDDDQPYIDYYSARSDTVVVQQTDGTEVAETYSAETYRSASDIVTKLNSSRKKLTEKDLKNLKKMELEILRNTIFARHGYAFKKKNYRQFFDSVDWYIPVSENVDKELTSLEKSNIKLLERFEKYAEDNYESFGR